MPMTSVDKKFAHRMIDAGRALPWLSVDRLVDMQFWKQNNYTIAEVTAKPNGGRKHIVLVGVAKRNPNEDADSLQRGKEVALARALRGEAEAL